MQLAGAGSAAAVLAGAPGRAARAVNGRHAGPSSASNISRITVEPLPPYDVDRLNTIMTTELADFSSFPITYPPARYGLDLYRVTYPSVIPEQYNRPTEASGLIAVPTGEDLPAQLPVVSYQHGTVFSKDEVPSNIEKSTETRLMLANFGGQGYVVIAPDYFGKGQSAETDSYTVKGSTQQACLDMFYAAQTAFPDLGVQMGKFFVSGWSQGGWGTMVFLEKLQSVGIDVTAAAIASAPLDLFATVNRWIQAPEPIDTPWLTGVVAIQLHTYQEYYGWPGFAAAAIKPLYQEAARKLYLNEITYEEAAADLPVHAAGLLQEDFIASLSIGSTLYGRTLQDNHAYRWRSATPIHTYWGAIDEVTPPYIATLPVDYQKIMGGAQATAIGTGEQGNHRGNFVAAIADQKQWFDELLAADK
jgi:pimeloyl-ACP methyl ester carboxylesterase